MTEKLYVSSDFRITILRKRGPALCESVGCYGIWFIGTKECRRLNIPVTDTLAKKTKRNANNFRDAMIEDIENGNTNYQASVYYMDIINQYERMGDFMINISQDLERGFAKR